MCSLMPLLILLIYCWFITIRIFLFAPVPPTYFAACLHAAALYYRILSLYIQYLLVIILLHDQFARVVLASLAHTIGVSLTF